MLSLHMVLARAPAQSLDAIIVPWLVAFGVAMAACCGSAGLGVMLAIYEKHRPQWRSANEDEQCKLDYFGEQSPEHDILQNVPQFGLLHGLLPLFAAAYITQALPLMSAPIEGIADSLSIQISLLFGYAGVVVAAVTFPLYNNMAHVRDLEARWKTEKDNGREEGRLAKHLSADKAFTAYLNVVVGAVAALAAMWMWIQALDSVISSVGR